MALSLCIWTLSALALPAMNSMQVSADKIASQFMSKFHVPGMAYAVLQDGKPVAQGTLGTADLQTGAPVTKTSIFPIASLSKPFVSLCLMSLAEKGPLNLEDPVGKYLTYLPPAWKQIPLERLLDHTSGIPDHYNNVPWNVNERKPISSDELIQKLMTLPMTSAPGVKYNYSNGNYALLAKVIEQFTHRTYPEFVDKKVFQPLGMKQALVLTLDNLPGCVRGYYDDGNKIQPALFNPGYCFGNGDIGASLSDLEKFDAGLYTEKVIKAATFEDMLRQRKLDNGNLPGYAMGWGISTSRGFDVFSHAGKVDGWRSHFVRFEKFNLTVIVLTNNGNPELGGLAADLAGTVVPDLALEPQEDNLPDLTRSDRGFVESIIQGDVDTLTLGPTLAQDYEAKSHWSGIAQGFKGPGAITRFVPSYRGASNQNGVLTRYRLEQGPSNTSVTVERDSAQRIISLWVFHS